jgi:hypothetical protein
MESSDNAVDQVFADAHSRRLQSRARLSDRGFDPDGRAADLTVMQLYELLGVVAASEKAGQSPTYALSRLALRAGLPNKIADALFLAYNQQSAEEAGHGDKVFAHAYFALGGTAPESQHSVFGAGEDVSATMAPSADPAENLQRLCEIAGVLGGIETVALQRVLPLVSDVCLAWNHPIGHDLVAQIRDVVRPEESRHVLTFRYVFHQLVVPQGRAAIAAYMQGTNVGRAQLGAPALDEQSLERLLGSSSPSVQQLMGKERALYSD